jgi:Zn-dependent membrane protease YugP|tara:strand:+ start:198 stop:395 length:198 start_codon:yes stop_codon:yes gene_type:complete
MTAAIDEIRKLFELYPSWLVTTSLIIVAAGILYVVWRVVKFGIVLMVTALLIALVVFVGWTLFGS